MTVSVAERVAGLDPRLPGIDELFDVRRAAALFDVVDCRLLTTRYEPGVSCVATYALVTGAASPDTVGVVELTPDERRVRSYLDDPELAGLAEAADPDAVGLLLDGAVDVRGCRVAPVRYIPGQRAVLRYDVATPTGPVVLYAKVVRAGITALEAAFAHLQERARAGTGPFVPGPIVVHERLGLLVLPAVEGRSFHALAFDRAVSLASRADGFRAAGRAIALLHDGPSPGNAVEPANDIAELARSADALRVIDPALAEQWEGALAALTAVEAVAAPTVPSHGALRTDQIVLAPDGPTLLDLDGFCAAPPARDLGNLLAYLRWRAIRRPEDADVCTAGRAALLAGYDASVTELGRHEGLSLLKIAVRRYRNLNAAEWPLVPDLVGAAASLARGAS